MKNVFQIIDGRKCWVQGTVTIEGVLHMVVNKFVKCDSNLNHRAWDVTQTKTKCPLCFKNESTQLRLFDI